MSATGSARLVPVAAQLGDGRRLGGPLGQAPPVKAGVGSHGRAGLDELREAPEIVGQLLAGALAP